MADAELVASSSIEPLPPQPRGDRIADIFRNDKKRKRLIEYTNLLRGVVITQDNFIPSPRLLFAQDADVTDYASQNNANARTITVEIEVASHSFSQSITMASLSVMTPWANATTGLSLENTQSGSSQQRTLFTSSNRFFPHGIVQPNVEYLKTKLHPDFINSIKSVVDGNSRDRREELSNFS